jgi:hypothetical protein
MTSKKSKLKVALDFPVIEFTADVKLVAQELKDKLRTFPCSDPRKTILYCIVSSGSMLDLAQDNEKALARLSGYAGDRINETVERIELFAQQKRPLMPRGDRINEAVERIEQRLNKCIESEKETQQILLEAGITNNETAMLWLSSASETIDRDVAELEALESRQLDEINAFFRSKGAPIDDET